jgi:hypothetical protein
MTPIYQMAFEPNGDNSFGLVFSEETEEFNQPVFVLPIIQNNQWWTEDYYLPGEIEGKYKEFRLTFKNGVFVLKDEILKHTIRFGVGLGDVFLRIHPIDRHFFYEELPLKYIGKHQNIVTPFDRFIPLSPLDLLIMDDAFRQHKACFVGLTPVFGERNDKQ